jgi:NTE family protein
VAIQGKEYVDGGLTSPIPVRAARGLVGPNDVVVAVDISSKPQQGAVRGTFDVLLQTFTIMGNQLGANELREADVVIRPSIPSVGSADFKARHEAILEGEKAALAALPAIRAKLGRAGN